MQDVQALNNFRDNLREALDYLDVTQDGLAEMAALSRPYINRVLAGKHEPSISTCDRIADSLQIPLTTFLANPAVFRRFLKNLERPVVTQ